MAKSILQKMARIQDMERGKLCPMRGGRYFNHQTWEQGRNVVRYVPAAQVESLRRSIDRYRHFLQLVDQYVELRVQQTRERNQRTPASQNSKPSAPRSQTQKGTRKGQR